MSAANKRALAGVCIGLVSAMVTSPVPVAARYARQEISASTYSALWVALPAVFCLVYFSLRRRLAPAIESIRLNWRALAIIGLLQTGGAVTFFWGMKYVDPTVGAFLGRFSTVFAVLIGVTFLRERFTRAELGGMVLAIAGAMVICYDTGRAELWAVLAILASNVFFAAFTAIVKVAVARTDPMAVMMGATTVATAGTVVFGLASGDLSLAGSAKAYGVLAVAAFAGEFLGMGMFYTSMKHIGFAVSSVVRSAIPFFVALLSYFTLGLLPDARGWTGGVVMMTGIVIIAVSSARAGERSEGAQSRACGTSLNSADARK